MELIINIDGASRGNPGPGSSAWIIKNTSGKLLLEGGEFFARCTNNFAEFSALKIALSKAAKLRGTRLKIRSDSLLLVKQYGGEYKIKNPDLRLIMADIKKAAEKFSAISLTHVPREQNKEADAMCNKIIDNALETEPAKKFLLQTVSKNHHEQLELFDFKD
ncbi:MAG: ribonuclease HI family protein [Elusimicrobiota bacterium]|jgi:ribonuclease HI|nr:ribonuclease HI family protein [Elusimicrobiota bacterium]